MAANEILATLMFVAFIALVFTGFPVAWILGGLSVIFTALAIVLQVDLAQLEIIDRDVRRHPQVDAALRSRSMFSSNCCSLLPAVRPCVIRTRA